ncbi:hypothetical protein [Flavobacterium algicola]|uniref:hypothetical protein n=1 Tax=Flavobacterium algicola TaxID=556529 RepID=UPI001EFE6D93|nr:hypothetical protein [Flavobacterium algicola]MCG9792710.1 hypothetical protein [Flavobacterium algicola]
MKLFRSFRRKLIALSKFKSYLAYALGEIVLIAIGISIAWKINNLNDIRKDNIVEKKIYANLNEELNSNLRTLNGLIDEYPQRITYLEKTLDYVGKQPNELTQGAKDTIINLFDTDVILLDNSINSILRTTKFEFIESTELKDLIILYPNKIIKFQEQNDKIKNLVNNRIKPAIEKHISLADKLPAYTKYQRIKDLGSKSDYNALLANKEYQNSIIDWLLQTQIQLNNAKNIRSKTKILIQELKTELD